MATPRPSSSPIRSRSTGPFAKGSACSTSRCSTRSTSKAMAPCRRSTKRSHEIFQRSSRVGSPHGPVLNDDGMMLDDSTCFVYGDDHVRVIGGGSMPDAIAAATMNKSLNVRSMREELCHLTVQGPRSRDLLASLTDTDMSNEAFPYYTFRDPVSLAGIDVMIARMGFTAELGYEVHGPIGQALDLWDAICEAGEQFGIRALGSRRRHDASDRSRHGDGRRVSSTTTRPPLGSATSAGRSQPTNRPFAAKTPSSPAATPSTRGWSACDSIQVKTGQPALHSSTTAPRSGTSP